MKKSCRTLAIFATLTIIATPQVVAAFTAQDCKDMGATFQDAIKSKAVFPYLASVMIGKQMAIANCASTYKKASMLPLKKLKSASNP